MNGEEVDDPEELAREILKLLRTAESDTVNILSLFGRYPERKRNTGGRLIIFPDWSKGAHEEQ